MKIQKYFITSLFFIAWLLPFHSLVAWDFLNFDDFSVMGRVSYYHPTSKRLRHVFSNGWADYEVQISKQICCDWKIWAGVDGFSIEGRKSDDRHKSHLQLIPLNLGLKYYFPFTCPIQLYISGAASYSFMRIKEHSHYFHLNKHKSGWGGLIEGGFDYSVWKRMFVNFFVQGYFQEFDFRNPFFISLPGSPITTIRKKTDVDFSGIKIGAGIGYQF